MGFGRDDISRINIIQFNQENPSETKSKIDKLMGVLDIVICSAVRRADLPKERMEYLIDRDMIKKMTPNSIVCDATACDKDFIETCVSSEKLDHTEEIEGVIHYSPDHIPSLTGRTSTELLSRAIYEYVSLIANQGVERALSISCSLRRGASFYRGKITHKYISDKRGFEYFNVKDIL